MRYQNDSGGRMFEQVINIDRMSASQQEHKSRDRKDQQKRTATEDPFTPVIHAALHGHSLDGGC